MADQRLETVNVVNSGTRYYTETRNGEGWVILEAEYKGDKLPVAISLISLIEIYHKVTNPASQMPEIWYE